MGSTLCQIFPLLFYGNVAATLFNILAVTMNRSDLFFCQSGDYGKGDFNFQMGDGLLSKEKRSDFHPEKLQNHYRDLLDAPVAVHDTQPDRGLGAARVEPQNPRLHDRRERLRQGQLQDVLVQHRRVHPDHDPDCHQHHDLSQGEMM